jgi:FkbH-like protein
LIAAVEDELFRRDAGTGEEPAWLAQALVRRSPARLWQILRAQDAHELTRWPELSALLTTLGQRLLAEGRTREADELAQTARRWQVRIDVAVEHGVAQAYAAAGDIGTAEARLQDVVKRQPYAIDSLRLLYTLVKSDGRPEQAHELLNRMVDAQPSMATATFAFRERAKIGAGPGRPVRMAILSSYVAEPLIPFLDVECRKAGLSPSVYVGAFNQYAQEILSPSSELYVADPEIVFLALALEDLFPAVTRLPKGDELRRAGQDIVETIAGLVRELRARSKALIVVHELAFTDWSPNGILDNRQSNSLVGWVEALNRELVERLRDDDAYVLPLRQVLSRVGTKAGADRKLRLMARMKFGESALRELAHYCLRYVKPLKGLTRKCVVLDLDGTLWGGVAGEVGPEGIQLGPTAPGVEFVEFQEALLNLTRRGVLLAVCSKNNPDDVLPILRGHPSMILREEHFSALRINWSNKADNLRELAAELNIGLDALVFIDDNPIERELIRQVLPEVLTVDVPRDPAQFRSMLEDMSDFELLALTDEDEARVAEYHVARKRRALQTSSASLSEYLHSLEITAAVGRPHASHAGRLAQMFNKTNQFNTTTRRYQAPEVDELLRSSMHHVYGLSVADRFGDHGLVGTAVVRLEGPTWRIESFLLSCRVMGLSVETALLAKIHEAARRNGVRQLVGEFRPTAKNRPAEDLYRRHGFRRAAEDGDQTWELDPAVDRIETPSWIAVRRV